MKPAPSHAGSSTIGSGLFDHLESITAPDWDTDRIGWCEWFLRENAAVYQAFRAKADEFRRWNLDRPISGEWIVNDLRFASNTRAVGDTYGISSQAKSLLSRLYKIEYPDANFDLRNSWLDHLSQAEWQRILNAWVR
jgi:hypothetical protein